MTHLVIVKPTAAEHLADARDAIARAQAAHPSNTAATASPCPVRNCQHCRSVRRAVGFMTVVR